MYGLFIQSLKSLNQKPIRILPYVLIIFPTHYLVGNLSQITKREIWVAEMYANNRLTNLSFLTAPQV